MKQLLSFDECKQMSRHIIAMNPNRNANMGKISSFILDYYTELTKQPWLSQLVGQIRDLTAQQNLMMQQRQRLWMLRSIRTMMTLPSPSSRSRRR